MFPKVSIPTKQRNGLLGRGHLDYSPKISLQEYRIGLEGLKSSREISENRLPFDETF